MQIYCTSDLLSLLNVHDVHPIPLCFPSICSCQYLLPLRITRKTINLLLMQLEVTEGTHHPRFTPDYSLCINSAQCFSSQLVKARAGFVSPITVTERAS